jgi:hypothetical protein
MWVSLYFTNLILFETEYTSDHIAVDTVSKTSTCAMRQADNGLHLNPSGW